MTRTVVTAMLVCLASWAGLAIGAGNAGLQRTISAGPLTLLEQPLAVVVSTGLAFAATAAVAAVPAAPRSDRWSLIGAVLAGDAVGALLIAPVLIGELEVRDAPVVFVVLAVLGLQPVAVALAQRVRRQGAPA